MPEVKVSEDELHAYADGVLPGDRIAAVESYLAAYPAEAARVAEWRAQVSAIRERFGGVAEEPVPERLQIENLAVRVSGARRKIAAAATIALIAGAAIGWFARDYASVPTQNQVARALAEAAIEAHRLYINEVRHPIEVRADEAHLLPWLSRRVGSPVRAPDLKEEGYKLLGGRLLPGSRGPAALIMYEGSGGERVTITCVRAAGNERSNFKWRQSDEFGALAWLDSGLGFVVAGPPDREKLDRIAREVYAAYEMPPAEKK